MEEKVNTSGPESAELEPDEMPWCAVDEEATLLLVSKDSLIESHMVELGLSGCRMLVRRLLPALPAVVETKFRVRGFSFRLGGNAESIDDGNAVLVRFSPMSPRRRDDLMEALSEIEADKAAKAALESASNLAHQDQSAWSREPGSGRSPDERARLSVVPASISRKSWLRHLFSGRADGATPDSVRNGNEAIGSGPPARPVLVGRRPDQGTVRARASSEEALPAHLETAVRERSERRSDPRCGVDTTAQIYLVKIRSKLIGQVLDLSLGGCRIRTTENFPVGIYTRVETEFRIQGISFRLGGVVQTIHGRQVVGIRFLDVSTRKREQLRELMEEIASMRSAGSDAERS